MSLSGQSRTVLKRSKDFSVVRASNKESSRLSLVKDECMLDSVVTARGLSNACINRSAACAPFSRFLFSDKIQLQDYRHL